MNSLLAHLDLHLPEMVAFVGSGGKTSIMSAVAADMIRQGARVVITNTTKVFEPVKKHKAAVVCSPDPRILLAEVRAALKTNALIIMGASKNSDQKLAGVSPEVVDDLFAEGDVDLVLLEADVSKGLPLKAPGPHESRIPEGADIVVPVVGLGGLNRPLAEGVVFRADQFGRLAGMNAGEPVTAGHVATVMFHRQGLLRYAPERARILPVLNQADLMDPDAAHSAAQIVYDAAPTGVDRVVWGSMIDPNYGFHAVGD